MKAEPGQSRLFALMQEQAVKATNRLADLRESLAVAAGIVKPTTPPFLTPHIFQLPARHSGKAIETWARAREGFWKPARRM